MTSVDTLRYLSMSEFAERLGVHPRTALHIRAQYPSYFTRIGRTWCISTAAFARFVDNHEGARIEAQPIRAVSARRR